MIAGSAPLRGASSFANRLPKSGTECRAPSDEFFAGSAPLRGAFSSQPGTAPWPQAGFRYQTGFDWIEIDVAFGRGEMFFVPNEAIPIVELPEITRPAEKQVRFPRRKPLPLTNN